MNKRDLPHVIKYYNLRDKYFKFEAQNDDEIEINHNIFYTERNNFFESLTTDELIDIRDTASSWHCMELCAYIRKNRNETR